MLIAIRGNKRRAEPLAKNESTGRMESCSGTLIIVTLLVILLLRNQSCGGMSEGHSVKGNGQNE